MRLEFGLRCCQEATQRMMRDLSFLFSSGRYAMIIIIIKSNQKAFIVSITVIKIHSNHGNIRHNRNK